MARKQSSTIWYGGNPHHEIYYNGHYHDAMYKGSELVWQKLAGKELKPVVDPNFMTCQNVDGDYWALVLFTKVGATSSVYGLAHRTDSGAWVIVNELLPMANRRYVMYATSKGCILTEYIGSSYSSLYFVAHYYALTEEIENNEVELHDLSEVTDGDILFNRYDESIIVYPYLGASGGASMSASTSYGCFLTKEHIYKYVDVTNAGKTTKKWVMFSWTGEKQNVPSDPSENVPRHKTSTVRYVVSGYGENQMKYALSGDNFRTVTEFELASMVGATREPRSSIGTYSLGAKSRSNTGNGQSFQQSDVTCLSESNRVFVMSAAWYEQNIDKYYLEKHTSLYVENGGLSDVGKLKESEVEVSSMPSTTPYPDYMGVYGIYYAGQDDRGYPKFYVFMNENTYSSGAYFYYGLYSEQTHSYIFRKINNLFSYPYSIGGVIPESGGDLAIISTTTDSYHTKKKVFNLLTEQFVAQPTVYMMQ